jgi:hypothetical protein
VILVDHLKRHEAIAGVGHGNGDRPGVEVKHRERIERVTVEPDDGLMVDGCRLSMMQQLSQAAGIFDEIAHIDVGFRAGKIVDRDWHDVLRKGAARYGQIKRGCQGSSDPHISYPARL